MMTCRASAPVLPEQKFIHTLHFRQGGFEELGQPGKIFPKKLFTFVVVFDYKCGHAV